MELKPLQTLTIVLVFLLVGGPAAWFTLQGTRPHGPGDLGVDRDGRLYAHFDDRVYVFDRQGEQLAVHDLGAAGFTSLYGGLSFFPDGDWLIAPEGGKYSGLLHRCSADAGLICTLLPDASRRFRRVQYLRDPQRPRRRHPRQVTPRILPRPAPCTTRPSSGCAADAPSSGYWGCWR